MGKRVIDAGRRPGLPRQPLQPAVRARGAAAAAGADRRRRDDRPHRALARGFRMGPFELQDLVGIDTGFEVSRVFYELGFGEPRWRPSPLSARMVAAGRLRPQDRPRLVRLRRRQAEHRPTTRSRRPPTPDPGADRRRARACLARGRSARGLRATRPARGAGSSSTATASYDGDLPVVRLLDARAARRRAAAAGSSHRCRRGGAGRATCAATGPGAAVLRRARPRPVVASRTASAACSAGWSARSSTSRLRAAGGRRLARRTSTPAWSSGSTTRAGRSRGWTRSARRRCCACSTGCRSSRARSATARRRAAPAGAEGARAPTGGASTTLARGPHV